MRCATHIEGAVEPRPTKVLHSRFQSGARRAWLHLVQLQRLVRDGLPIPGYGTSNGVTGFWQVTNSR
jgi:hypothetical protein